MSPLTVEAHKESGADTRGQTSKCLHSYLGVEYTLVISVCNQADEKCPAWPGKTQKQHWGFEDPAAAKGTREEQLNVFRKVRDQIKDRIETWLRDKNIGLRGNPPKKTTT